MYTYVTGGSPQRSTALRSLSNGELRLDEKGFLPKNTGLKLGNANPTTSQPGEELLVAGDVRSNEQPVLTVLHTLWVREHNRLARKVRCVVN